jgi:hypothetical protein
MIVNIAAALFIAIVGFNLLVLLANAWVGFLEEKTPSKPFIPQINQSWQFRLLGWVISFVIVYGLAGVVLGLIALTR